MERYDERGRAGAPGCSIPQHHAGGETDRKRALLPGYPLPGPEFLRGRFPHDLFPLSGGRVDITTDLIPVFPCQHYLMGGIDVSVYGDTTVDRLYAAGECSHRRPRP